MCKIRSKYVLDIRVQLNIIVYWFIIKPCDWMEHWYFS